MLIDSVHVALLMMRAKPVRAALSLLGIYIGVLALVIILAIREGVRQQIDALYATQGAQVVFVHPGFDPQSKQIGRITSDDAVRLQESPGVLSALARLSSDLSVRSETASMRAHVSGIDEVFTGLYRVRLRQGRNFFPDEVRRNQPLCLITEDAASRLFPAGEPLGGRINIRGTLFRVIGIMDWTMETGQRSAMPEVDIVVPYPFLASQDGDFISTLEVRVSPDLSASQAVRQVAATMSHRSEARQKRYIVRSLAQMGERSREFNNRILAGLLGIAAISLLVGGIGVANVMITSVTERTREVGIRKALGATRLNILSQFLVEAAMMSFCGGFLAVLSGAFAVNLVPVLFAVPVPLVLPTWPCVGCLVLTLFIGIVAGVYPASRAAHLSPAEALRFE